ncbi:ATP binding protein [Methylomonas albis]|uniref:AAA family ATPase n=1 Tax=Methylomonas albis TaxID=1854563 RepID=A0ABR9D6K7_9GAMM|nr:AAA family ATPase [Methylomonas albis]MBD9357532.1 AAA family ATPase [Methylomonas albis]CAD6880815.1 ATP binding protein [Methylomonas albis]
MKINKLELLDFRCFNKYEIELSKRFTLLIGDNGSGKTGILDALVIAIADLLFEISAITAYDKRRISLNDMRYVEIQMGQEPIKNISKDTFIVFDGFFLNTPIHWINGRGQKKFYCLSKHDLDGIEELDELVRPLYDYVDKIKDLSRRTASLDTLFPVVAYYGTGRLWQQLKAKDKKIKGIGSRTEGYQNCLNPATNQHHFFNWFKKQELITLQKQERRHALEAVRESIVSMIPDAQQIWWDFEQDELMIRYIIQQTQKNIQFSMLSDGYRNMIGMVADIAYRMATLNPQLEADVIKQTEGIVLIDEIDLHLHPKWQREVVGRLLNTFPKVQFVASSHSPFIIQSLYGREDCLLWDLEKAQPLTIESKSIEDIAENQQGVEIPQQSQRFLDMEKAAEEYYRVLKQIPPASDDEKQHLKQRLDELLLPFSDDPAFQAFLKMERQTVEGSQGL